MGYAKFKVNETVEYDGMIEPPLRDGDRFAWVRGRVAADLDGDKTLEEAVLVTRQAGREENPGPIESATLLIVKRPEHGSPKLLRRVLLYEGMEDWGAASAPAGVWPKPTAVRPTRAALHAAEVDDTGRAVVVLTLWGAADADGVYATLHKGIRLVDDAAPTVFTAQVRQREPGITNTDLDKDGIHELLLHQAPLVFPDSPASAPAWLTIYKQSAAAPHAPWLQADKRFPPAFQALALAWYEQYGLLAPGIGTEKAEEEARSATQTPQARKAAGVAYYLGRIHGIAGQPPLARQYLERAATGLPPGPFQDLARQSLQEVE